MTTPATEPARPLALPAVDPQWAAFLDARASTELDRFAARIAELKDGTTRDTVEALRLWNEADTALGNVASIASLLAEVHPDEQVRTLAETASQRAAAAATDRDLDRVLYDVLAGLEHTGLDESSARLLNRVLRDFRRSGVDRDEATRERLRAIAERAVLVGQEFGRNIRDDVRSIRVSGDALAGLPEDYRAAHPVDADGLVTITTDYPDIIPFRTFARDAAARRALTLAFLNRAWPANDPLLHELLDLRAEQAALVGYSGWPDYDAEVKMVRSGEAIAKFIDAIAAAAEAPGRADYDVLLARAQADDALAGAPVRDALDSADAAYYAEAIRREQFDVDAQQVRRYFDFSRVRDGLLAVTGRLFGIEYRPVPDAPRWHRDVDVYDVLADGELRGRIYLDLHPREGKYKHAAQFDLVPGVEGDQLPEGALVCNFSSGLLEHSDVVTLFHEFGHLVHHVLGGRQRYARFSGVATEWDFVEAPSQMLEEWAWDPQVLRSFAVDAGGEAIPVDLVERMRRADDFGTGYFARTQMFYAAIAYYLHRDRPEDHTAFVREMQARYDLFRHIDGTHFQASFGHLDGYSSGYYTYMWSLVIAKDMFSAFDPDDLFDPEVAHRYRDRVLARGGSGDAADLVADFLGRPYSFDAFGAWLSRAASPSIAAGSPGSAGLANEG